MTQESENRRQREIEELSDKVDTLHALSEQLGFEKSQLEKEIELAQ